MGNILMETRFVFKNGPTQEEIDTFKRKSKPGGIIRMGNYAGVYSEPQVMIPLCTYCRQVECGCGAADYER